MTSRLFSESFLRQLERLAVLYRRAAAGPLQGERRSARRGQSVEFSDFRPYTMGDDFRRIDWNAYARLERLFIKLFVEEQDLTVHLLIDASRSMDWGEPNKLAYATRLSGALSYIALVGLDRVTVTALGDSRPPALRALPALRGKQMALRVFNFLETIQPGMENPVTALNSYAANASFPGPLLLVSDLMDDGWQPALSHLAGRGFEVSLLHLLAPDEIDPGLEGDFRLLDAEGRASVEISANFETLERYRTALASWRQSWRHFCAARRMHYVPISTAEPLEDLLFAQLPLQGVLK
jgi:uncharacterized protein (DUF58 family)